MTTVQSTTKVQERSTGTVAASNAGGAGLNAAVTAILLFALGRYFGSRDAIPHDVLEIFPYIVVGVGGVCHFFAELWTVVRRKITRILEYDDAPTGSTGTGDGGTGTGTGNGEPKGEIV